VHVSVDCANLYVVIPGRPEGPGAHPKSALADLDIQVPISGKPEIGARPGMTADGSPATT
jgi:hypothetical protein